MRGKIATILYGKGFDALRNRNSATKGCSLVFNCKNLFYLRNRSEIKKKESSAESGQVSPDSLLRAAPPGKVPSLQKSSPFVPHGLHSLFADFHTIHPAVVFFCHTFCNPPTVWDIAFSRSSNKSISQSTHEAKKDVCTPTTTTVLHLRQKKTTQSYYT